MKKKTKPAAGGQALQKFIDAWADNDLDAMGAALHPMVEKFGKPKIWSARLEQLPGQLEPENTEWWLEFPGGQRIAVVINWKGDVIRRTYSDRGDTSARDVLRLLRGWQKSVERNGRPPKADLARLLQAYEAAGWDKSKIKNELGVYLAGIFPRGIATATVQRQMADYKRRRKKV